MKTKLFQFLVLLICIVFNLDCKEKVETNRMENKNSLPPLISLKAEDINLLEIGDTINLTELPESRNAIVTGSGGLVKHYITKIDNIEYDLGLSNNGILNFIGTSDTNFITKENLKIGDSYEQIKLINSQEAFYEPGFALSVKLNSGWNASLKIGNFDAEIDKSDLNREIDFFFRK